MLNKRNGFYCEVGAYDGGVEYSETFYLRDQLNWKGILCGHKYPATTKSQ
tara:strand:- start:55 stop:204 length:150 start_codon:yes stop_codon:yes gene_type:complete